MHGPLAASGAANNPAFGLGLSSSDLEDADSSAASTPALNPLAATAAVLMASQQKATKANKDLLEKSVINSAANCDFVSADFSDDDDDDDEEVSCLLYCRASLSAFYAPIGCHPTFSDIFDGFSRLSPLFAVHRTFLW